MTGIAAPPGYELGFLLGSGGMAEVRYGRRVARGGFAYAVAVKQLHPHLGDRPELARMFLDEARLAARVSHANVVPILDLVEGQGRAWAIMPYVEGESLARLCREVVARGDRVPPRIAASIALDLLAGLGAAHDATDEQGAPLGIVHRDVSPQNVLVGVDGIARVLDFGVAKARGRLHETRDGQVKGKLAYMAPEQLAGDASAATDVYAAAIVLWEMLAGRRLFDGESEMAVVGKVMAGATSPPSAHAPIPPALDLVVVRALCLDPAQRFATAADMERAIERATAGDVATRAEVAAWVSSIASGALAERRAKAAELAARPEAPTWDEVSSQDEGLSAMEVPTARTRRRSQLRVAALALVAVLGVAGALVARRAVVVSAAGIDSAEVAPPSEHALLEPMPARVGLVAPAVAEAAAPRAGRVAAPRKDPRPKAEGLPTAEPPAEDCEIPYVIDASGARRYKRACIR